MQTSAVENDFPKTLGLGRTARITSEVVVGKHTGKRTTLYRAHDAASCELLNTGTQRHAGESLQTLRGFALC